MLFLFWLIWAINFCTVSAEVVSSPPVLIWGTNTPENSEIFRPVSTEDFFRIMLRIHSSEHMIVLYFASELTAKDITCPTCFPNLKKIKPMNYYSKVEKPLEAIEKVGPVIWHDPVITDPGRKDNEMELSCQAGTIHGFNFNDRNFAAQDSAIIRSHSHLGLCPVVHVYTGFEEEKLSLERRRSRYKNLIITKSITKTVGTVTKPPVNQADMSAHYSVNNASGAGNVTILRLESAILAFNSITLATRTSAQSPFLRSHLVLTQSNQTMQVGMYNDMNPNAGMILVLDTDLCPLVIELLPVKGNWHLTRVICGNHTLYPRELIFFSNEFSLCCSDVSFFSSDKSRLSLFNFYLDIITSEMDNGMDSNYGAKPCWTCEHIVTATLTQTMVVMLFFIVILWIGLSFITSIGRNEFVQVAADPDLYIKADR